MSAELIETALSTGEDERVDIEVLVSDADLTPPPGYRVVPLLTEPYVVVLPRGHRLAGREAVEMAELAGEPESMVFALPKELRLRLVD